MNEIAAERGLPPALPPQYAVRAYLRQQAKHASFLFSEGVRQLGADCAEAYYSGLATTQKMQAAAGRFGEVASSAGAFTIVRTYTPPSKAFPQRERSAVAAFFMEPVGLIQVNRTSGLHYSEEAILLRTFQSEFRRKKANFGLGTGTLILTRHLLERVYERTEVHHEQFTALINSEFADLLRSVALARAAGIWIDGEDEGGTFRVGAVPYSNGLIRLEARVVLAQPKCGELGFRIEMPSFKDHRPFLNPASVIQGAISSAPDMMAIEVTCGVTYLSVTQLSPSEVRYYYSFKALRDELETSTLDRLANAYCAPQFPHERPMSVDVSDRAGKLVQSVRGLLDELSLHPSQSGGVCFLGPSEYVQPKSK